MNIVRWDKVVHRVRVVTTHGPHKVAYMLCDRKAKLKDNPWNSSNKQTTQELSCLFCLARTLYEREEYESSQ